MSINILDIKTLQCLRNLDPRDFPMGFTHNEFDHIARVCNALWLYPGEPRSDIPHAVTTQGECTDGFIDVLRILKNTNLSQIIARQLYMLTSEFYAGPIDWVLGSDHAGAAISKDFANIIGAQHDFTEKDSTPGSKKQLWKRFTIEPEEVVMRVEELVTTLGTLERVTQGVEEGNLHKNVKFAPICATVVHRSDLYTIGNDPLVYVRHYDIGKWAKQNECPYCAVGSKRIEKPKLNWDELNVRPRQ